MKLGQRIVKWNKQRGLLDKKYNHQKEISFIIEECLESTGKFDSLTARTEAEKIAEQICQNANSSDEEKVDAFADMVVFAMGAMAKLNYDPDTVMDEVMKHIESRTGKIIDGKFVKDKDIEVYQPDFERAKK